jgi:hypothetical protein
MSDEHTGERRGTLPAAHAYIQVSRTDGSFFEVGVNLVLALGPHDVEDALVECSTSRDVLACLLHFVQDESGPVAAESPSHADQVPLSDAEMERSSRLLREALGDETDSGA